MNRQHERSNPVINIVFPTGVGMNRGVTGNASATMSFPHRRGDEPASGVVSLDLIAFSPQAWG